MLNKKQANKQAIEKDKFIDIKDPALLKEA